MGLFHVSCSRMRLTYFFAPLEASCLICSSFRISLGSRDLKFHLSHILGTDFVPEIKSYSFIELNKNSLSPVNTYQVLISPTSNPLSNQLTKILLEFISKLFVRSGKCCAKCAVHGLCHYVRITLKEKEIDAEKGNELDYLSKKKRPRRVSYEWRTP